MGTDTIFISYSHDSPEHSERVRALANALIALGLDVELDQFVDSPEHGWPHWCEERLRPENAKYVLVICTPTYRSRVENKVSYDEGRGVYWEGALIHQYIYDEKGNKRFIPVLLGDAPDDSVPLPLRPFTRYRIKKFDLSDPGFEALYRRLTGQPAVVRPPPGQRAELRPREISAGETAVKTPAAKASDAPPAFDISRIDTYAPAELIGREADTKGIDDAWAKAVMGEPHPRVLTFVALGGEGKTALVAKWAIGQSDKDWPGCEAAFAWSFYSQGTREQLAASSDLFLAEALKFFAAPAVEGVESAHDKGRRLAKCIGDKRAILILDGLEPLQYAPTSPTPGELKDEGLRALLKGLAQRNKGLCLVTTRYRIKDLEGYAESAPQHDLAPLTKEAGAKLLERLGVKGTRQEREKLSEDVKGHALTLNLIGSYLAEAYGGDIRKRDLVKLGEADEEEQHASKAMDAYVRWFQSEGEKGARALATLRLMGLFDRPADAGCLGALWKAPPIDELTEPLIGLSEAQRNIVISRLAATKLVTVNRDAGGALVSLDAHPLLREYFAKDLRKNHSAAWKAAHQRLYEHLTNERGEGTEQLVVGAKDHRSAEGFAVSGEMQMLEPIFEADFEDSAYCYHPGRSAVDAIREAHRLICPGNADIVDADVSKHFDTIPHADLLKSVSRRVVDRTTIDKPKPTLDDLDSLYQAVAHGCHAGMQQAACDNVYHDRILRGTGSDGHYSVHKLGALGADLGAVACFFDSPWERVSPNLTSLAQAWLLHQAAYLLRGLGRVREALGPMRAALNLAVEQNTWRSAAIRASNLTELEMTLGDVDGALREGKFCVAYADRSGDAFQSVGNRTTLADALHQAGRRTEAEALFVEAEAMQAGRQPHLPMLYALQGFRYCDLLLGDAERVSWMRLVADNGYNSATSPPALEACRAVSNRAARTLEWMESDTNAPVLTAAVEHLTLARAALYRAILSCDAPASEHLEKAIRLIDRASDQAHVPSGLLTRALFRAATGDFDGARENLDEAYEIAERGPMRLHVADIHLHRARLFGLIANRPEKYPWVSPRDDLDQAKKLIDECGYGRRREELADAEAAWKRICGSAAP